MMLELYFGGSFDRRGFDGLNLTQDSVKNLDESNFSKILDFVLFFVGDMRQIHFELDEFFLKHFDFGFPVFEEGDNFSIFLLLVSRCLVIQKYLKAKAINKS